ncbi:M56 family metallopeptidase [Mucilaginibacter sp. FT3.2]|uniref:M56 family metallopeptidase n=1 Tax=Mucilaginibacter sp. FT3.2 TaxID=2723090 RepID=UPI00161FD7FA|nr:M56 family metallopeptidase [Mucilaginibacter sp. FT3.2]MBB6229601.1 beta-lactamase regulating signal transducer with metallopeptidase domain [Mucilaginibacter sp. FT3.2]
MNWLHYLIEANIYLAVFYACYCLFLAKETHYTLNRAYLLLSCIASFILPVIQIGVLKPIEKVPEIAIVAYNTVTQANSATEVDYTTLDDALWAAYIVGIAVLALLLFIKLFKLINLTTSGKTLIDNKYKLIDVEDMDTAFSFFNYLFIGTKTTGSDIIIRHELVHIRQKHSADIIFIEVLKVISWFNPIIYLMQISLKTLHEYIADEQTATHETDAVTYSTFLVDNAYGLNGSSITHSFFNYNLLKKRIIMLNQKRSGRLARLKYLVAVPICAGMLCASTLAFSKNYGWVDIAPKHNTLPANVKTTPAIKSPNAAADTTARSRIKTKATTAKGYNYEETGYLINKKTDFRVIITDKNGAQKEFYKSKASAAELAMLREKYGYSFPKMLIYPKLPPPPPMPPTANITIDKMPPPPPPAPPKHNVKGLHRLPPPQQISLDDVNKTPPPPPPAPPVGAAQDISKMPPPAPPVDAKDVVVQAYPAHSLRMKRSKTSKVKAVSPLPEITIDEPKSKETPAPAAAPADVKPAAQGQN